MRQASPIMDPVKDDKALWRDSPLLSKENLKNLDKRKVPKHIAFIPDGNRRWAKRNLVMPEEGHRIGADILLNIIKASHQIGIETLTFYIFSTENWARPKREVKAQIWLLEKSLKEQKQRMLDNGVRFLTIGDLTKFPQHILDLIQDTVEATKDCSNIDVVFAMNYGGRDDITRAVRKIASACAQGELDPSAITEEMIGNQLDTASWRDPDLLIRTSGESRVSNFLLWQISYAEIYLTDLYWPEFGPQNLLEAVYEFQNRERRRGS